MGFPPEMFTVLFAIPRTVGWLAQWQELIADPEQKIARPRQIYTGHMQREFVPMEKRAAAALAAG
jgi:citrate synthase